VLNFSATGLRRTALTLHAMAPRDRDWLLSQLAPDQRAAVRQLLDELNSLGILADPALLQEALRQHRAQQTSPVSAADGRREHRHRCRGDGTSGRAGAATGRPGGLAQLLMAEPEALVAWLLHLRDWHWQAQLLSHFGAPQRQRILAQLQRLRALPQTDVAAAQLAACLMMTLYQRLRVQPALPASAPAPVAASAGRWGGWWRRSVTRSWA
jgi:hypothetical protein